MKLTLFEIDIMKLLENKAMRPSKIADEFEVHRPHVSRAIRKLKKLRYIEPLKGSDKREIYFKSTMKYESMNQ